MATPSADCAIICELGVPQGGYHPTRKAVTHICVVVSSAAHGAVPGAGWGGDTCGWMVEVWRLWPCARCGGRSWKSQVRAAPIGSCARLLASCAVGGRRTAPHRVPQRRAQHIASWHVPPAHPADASWSGKTAVHRAEGGRIGPWVALCMTVPALSLVPSALRQTPPCYVEPCVTAAQPLARTRLNSHPCLIGGCQSADAL
jgi:hypothetical protein